MRRSVLGVAPVLGLLALSACEINTPAAPAAVAAPSPILVTPAPMVAQPGTVVVQPRSY